MPPWVLALAAALVAFPAGHGAAHSPARLDPDRPFVIDDPTISRALYGEVTAPGQVFVIRMTPATRLALPFEVLVPHRDGLRDHRPAYAVIAAGLPPVDAETAARLPRPLPDGAGAYVAWNDAPERDAVFESYLRRVYWTSGPIALLVPAGDVEIWIWSPAGTRGDFVLGFGVEEGAKDLGDLIWNWSDYAY